MQSSVQKAMGRGKLAEDESHRCVIYDLGGSRKLTFRLSFDPAWAPGKLARGHWLWEVTEVNVESCVAKRIAYGPVKM
jgi:hypothetical protein